MIDELDARLIDPLAAAHRVGVLEAARRLSVARGTVQARLDRLRDRGVITGYGPDVDPAAVGFRVTAFVTLEIRQAGGHDPVAAKVGLIAEVLGAPTITGPGAKAPPPHRGRPRGGTPPHDYRSGRPQRLPHPAPSPGRRPPRLAARRCPS